MEKKVVVVVVTYNRLALLKEMMELLLAQTYKPYKICLIDNASTDGTDEYCQHMQKENPELVEHYRMQENTGGSGGFAEGVKIAAEQGADYIWGMDDDAMPDIHALQLLVEATERFSGDRYCLRSNTYYIDEKGDFVLEQITEHDQRKANLTFVGFFVSREIVSKIGYPRSDLFIYYDDKDYQLRIQENGFEIIGIRESVIRHPYIMPMNTRRLFGIKVIVPEMPRWKMYYWMRNLLLIRKQRKRRYFFAVVLAYYSLMKIFLYNREYFDIARTGLKDGLAGKTGHKPGLP